MNALHQFAFAVGAATTLAFSQPVFAEDAAPAPQKVMVTLSSGDPQAQAMALVLSTQMRAKNADVRLLLCGEAGNVALQGHPPVMLKPRDMTPQGLLQNLISKGATVQVCAIFLPNAGKTAEALIEGVTAAQPPDIAGYLLQPDVRTFGF